MGWFCQACVFEERFPFLANVTDTKSSKHESKGNKRIFTVTLLKTTLTSEFMFFIFNDVFRFFQFFKNILRRQRLKPRCRITDVRLELGGMTKNLYHGIFLNYTGFTVYDGIYFFHA